ncbi:vacuolar amino acid transporter 1 isoform X6 [Arachis ipaensis]|uniref:vacuolar amino acid transporter 1 isoform X6 n=1 Tax=Arachis ipaensis TaxID=130454 RepID=UPI000A2B8346|nr:vacuolar amino acid transporter 1 isoform X6 [Arachis ipaensis]
MVYKSSPGEMKLEEDLGPDREDDFQTDDEENQGNRVFDNLDDDSESDSSVLSQKLSNDNIMPSWPQSYRQSMDMLTSVTPPGISFLRRIGSKGSSNNQYLTTAFKRSQEWKQEDSSLAKPLVSDQLKEVENGVSEEQPARQQSSVFQHSKFSLDDLPPPQHQCSFAQSVINDILIHGIAAAVEFITLMSDNLSSLFPNVHIKVGGIDLETHVFFAITAALMVLPTVWLRNLSLLSYISAGGIFATIMVTLCLFWVGLVEHVGLKPGRKLLDLENISVSVGLYGFGFAGHAVFPNVYSSMQDPSRFPSVLYLSFAFCLFMYMSVGAVGYLTFGESVESQFTLNMPKELYASKIATWTTVITPLAKYALTILPIALSIEELIPNNKLRCHATAIAIRTFLVISSLVVALSVPYFGALMALIGAFMSMTVALIYPCACYLKIHNGRLSKLEITKCVLVIIVGVLSSIVGTYSALLRIANGDD